MLNIKITWVTETEDGDTIETVVQGDNVDEVLEAIQKVEIDE